MAFSKHGGHDLGNVKIDDGYWLVLDDAINEIGADAARQLRNDMETCLATEWAALQGRDAES